MAEDKDDDWIGRQPLWLQVLLLPLMIAVIPVSMAGMAFFILVYLPFLMFKWSVEEHRFMRKLKERGQVGQWTDVESLLCSNMGTLLVEIGPKGPSSAWWIDQNRERVDPQHVVPTWQDFEDGRDIHESGDNGDSKDSRALIELWTMEHLGQYASSAKRLFVSWSQLAKLDPAVKQGSVLTIGYFKGRLSKRLRASTDRGADDEFKRN